MEAGQGSVAVADSSGHVCEVPEPRLGPSGSRLQRARRGWASWPWAWSRAPAPGDSRLVSHPLSRSPAPPPAHPRTSQDAYSEIAYLFAEFFRDLDIVPSDIIAGLVLLRQRQRAKRNAVLDEVGTTLLRASPRCPAPGVPPVTPWCQLPSWLWLE